MKNTVQGGWKKPGSSGVNVKDTHKGGIPGMERVKGVGGAGQGHSAVYTAKSSKMNPSKGIGG